MAVNSKRPVTRTKDVLHPKDQPAVATPDPEKGEHLNFMGGLSYEAGPLTTLRMAAASCFFGEPTYYQGAAPKKGKTAPLGGCSLPSLSDALRTRLNSLLDSKDPQGWRGLSPQARMETAIDAALNENPEATLQFAVELRNRLMIRTTPQVVMVRAAMHPKVKGTRLIAKYAPGIMSRLDEVTVQAAYFLSLKAGRMPKNLERAWKRRIEHANRYEMAKYRMDARVVKLTDVISLVHAKGLLIDELMRGDLKQGSDDTKTWESERSAGKSWDEAAKSMGHMALLRNLRNMFQAGELTAEHLKHLVETAPKGRQIPFRYLSAFNALTEARATGAVLDAIEECLEISMDNLPEFPGNVAVLSDNSGSARHAMTSEMGTMTICGIGNLMGALTAKRATGDGTLFAFGDSLTELPVRKKASVFDITKELAKQHRLDRGATEHGVWLFFKQAIEQRRHYDWIFVYSDMQAGHGGLYGTSTSYVVEGHECRWADGGVSYPYISVADLVNVYRRTVNRDVRVFLVQTAGYQDTLVPEWYDQTWILGGWSPEIIRFAAYVAGSHQLQQVVEEEESDGPVAQ